MRIELLLPGFYRQMVHDAPTARMAAEHMATVFGRKVNLYGPGMVRVSTEDITVTYALDKGPNGLSLTRMRG